MAVRYLFWLDYLPHIRLLVGMKINEQFIIDYLTYKASRPLKTKELAKELDIPSKDYQSFRKMVKGLVDSGKLVQLRRGRVGVPSELNLQVGEISIGPKGYGKMTTDSGEPITIIPTKLETALDGDRVTVRLKRNEDGELSGTVIKVLERAQKNIIGTFKKGKHFSTVIPGDKRFRRGIYVPNKLTKKASDNDRVLVKITLWEQPYQNPEGEIVEILGRPGESKVNMLTVIKNFNLPERFPRKVIAEAENIDPRDMQKEFKRRPNFTRDVAYTIDPADAKDHDDAISVKRTRDGYRLGVYIADVSYFVGDRSMLDKEAFQRGTSVYLPGMVIPMLPEQLSNDLCSLKPNRRRLVMAVHINFGKDGQMKDWEIGEGVLTSRAKLSYEEVQEFFNSGEMTPRIKRVADSLKDARRLANLLQKRRMAAGSLDFDLPEAKIVMDKKGEVVEIGSRIRLESHRLVEEFMLAANKAVALHFFRRNLQTLYRVHDKPDLETLNAFSYMMTTLGYKFPVSDNMKPIQFSKFLDRVKGKPEEELINELMLRSMKKAVYHPNNIGHFGLAFSHYLHFTSPIRRYPDMLVHRLLRLIKNDKYPAKLDKRLDSILKNAGRVCSETERVAEAAEREAVKFKQVEFMARKVGHEYNGVISGILNFGFFVRLDKMGAEGMVRLSTLDDDYYNYDEKHYRLVGKRTGRVFRMGDPVKVTVLSVDKVKNQINLILTESDGDAVDQRGRKKSAGRKKKGGKKSRSKKSVKGQ